MHTVSHGDSNSGFVNERVVGVMPSIEFVVSMLDCLEVATTRVEVLVVRVFDISKLTVGSKDLTTRQNCSRLDL
jgi:hypothetical protein